MKFVLDLPLGYPGAHRLRPNLGRVWWCRITGSFSYTTREDAATVHYTNGFRICRGRKCKDTWE